MQEEEDLAPQDLNIMLFFLMNVFVRTYDASYLALDPLGIFLMNYWSFWSEDTRALLINDHKGTTWCVVSNSIFKMMKLSHAALGDFFEGF